MGYYYEKKKNNSWRRKFYRELAKKQRRSTRHFLNKLVQDVCSGTIDFDEFLDMMRRRGNIL
jgi:Ca2+-binding EF-hand superfamily protein